MKKIGMALIALALILAVLGLSGCGQTAAQTVPSNISSINLNGQQTGIWVNGQGSVYTAPDIVTLSLGVQTQAATVVDAQSQAAISMDAVIKALTANGVDNKDIQTQSYNIQRLTRYDPTTQKEILVGYSVNNMVSVKIRAIDKAGPIIDAVTAAGGDATRINSIGFSVEDPTKSLESARQKAMADAQAKATQLSSLAGVKLGLPTYINENSQIPVPRVAYSGAVPAPIPAPTTPISGGELQIIVYVQVVYSIID